MKQGTPPSKKRTSDTVMRFADAWSTLKHKTAFMDYVHELRNSGNSDQNIVETLAAQGIDGINPSTINRWRKRYPRKQAT